MSQRIERTRLGLLLAVALCLAAPAGALANGPGLAGGIASPEVTPLSQHPPAPPASAPGDVTAVPRAAGQDTASAVGTLRHALPRRPAAGAVNDVTSPTRPSARTRPYRARGGVSGAVPTGSLSAAPRTYRPAGDEAATVRSSAALLYGPTPTRVADSASSSGVRLARSAPTAELRAPLDIAAALVSGDLRDRADALLAAGGRLLRASGGLLAAGGQLLASGGALLGALVGTGGYAPGGQGAARPLAFAAGGLDAARPLAFTHRPIPRGPGSSSAEGQPAKPAGASAEPAGSELPGGGPSAPAVPHAPAPLTLPGLGGGSTNSGGGTVGGLLGLVAAFELAAAAAGRLRIPAGAWGPLGIASPIEQPG